MLKQHFIVIIDLTGETLGIFHMLRFLHSCYEIVQRLLLQIMQVFRSHIDSTVMVYLVKIVESAYIVLL